jgi:predicted nuclease with TOPRIM domain
MTPKEINDLKKEHNALLERGQELYADVMKLHKQVLELQDQIKHAEREEYDPIPLIFGGGFWIDPEL